jgi:hypothetical protein
MSEEKDNKWKMPQPVFKSSEGSLPKSLEETISTSFMANAETIEIDEDDDILGIMDTLPGDYSLPTTDHDEDILETEPAVNAEPVQKTEVTEELPPTVVDEPQPVKVTAKESPETSESKPDAAGSGFSGYILLLLAAIVLGALYYFLVLKK